MPELPEVETVRRSLVGAIGTRITGVWDSGRPLHAQRRPPRRALRSLLDARITNLRRHGKYLLIDTDRERAVLVHLGMTGQLLLGAKRTHRRPHTHVVFELGKRELAFVDPRRFGQIDVVVHGREHDHPSLAVLGPDALLAPPDPLTLWRAARGRRTTLKAFILDQSVLAGVGNIYASEALWRAQLRPSRRTFQLTRDGASRLVAAIGDTFANALDNGGTTLSDFVNAEGKAGDNASYLWVYDRAGQPCQRCATTVKRSVQQGRATYYCPTCQAR